ncbi:MAG: polyprenyl synthetase family protein, partial [Gammaproteobacteria bacterium]|nr:polyprenyl synthetase family protein [Gammaproteobacteria bacterium]
MDYEAIKALVRDDLRAVDREIEARLQSDVALINQMGSYIVQSGGKRLRPVLVLLGSRAFGYQGHDHIRLAAIIEFIHTATLLHDDVVDASELRRGHTTANTIWGNEASVLVGDFLYSRAFEMMVEVGSMRIMEILAHTTNTIAEGEVLQLLNCHDAETTEQRYLEVVSRKTAKLFEAAARIGAILGGQPEATETALAAYGMHLGVAFQLVDDALDYSASPEDTGKNLGDDLAEGKPTLPLIHAINTGTPEQSQLLRKAIENG